MKKTAITRSFGIVTIVISICLLFSCVVFAALGSPPGTGTPNDPYLIEDLADFDTFADPCNGGTYWAAGVYTKLMCNPDLAGRTYTTSVIGDFQGVFEGNGHKIINLTIDTGGADHDSLGFWGCIDLDGSVNELGIEDVSITNGDSAYSTGGLCGSNGGSIINCYTTGSVNGGQHEIGGICGWNHYGSIINCYSTCSVSGESDLGGLCGWNNYGSIRNCYATGTVTGEDWSVVLGGLCGDNLGSISSCYSTGLVSAGDWSSHLGGLCGDNLGSISNSYSISPVGTGIEGGLSGLCGVNTGSISNCYATGSVSGGNESSVSGLCQRNEGSISNCYATGLLNAGVDSSLSGLCGANYYGSFTACFWDITVNPALADCGYDYATSSYNVDLPNVFAETTVNMQTQSTFTDEGWDFVSETTNGNDNYWRLCVNGVEYPYLSWESPTDDLACPDGVDYVDFAYFASRWLDINCETSNDCGGADLDISTDVGLGDLLIFTQHWLQGTQ